MEEVPLEKSLIIEDEDEEDEIHRNAHNAHNFSESEDKSLLDLKIKLSKLKEPENKGNDSMAKDSASDFLASGFVPNNMNINISQHQQTHNNSRDGGRGTKAPIPTHSSNRDSSGRPRNDGIAEKAAMPGSSSKRSIDSAKRSAVDLLRRRDSF